MKALRSKKTTRVAGSSDTNGASSELDVMTADDEVVEIKSSDSEKEYLISQRKSGKKRKKRHHHRSNRNGKDHNRVSPMTVWAKTDNMNITDVVCADHDISLRITRVNGDIWKAGPVSEGLTGGVTPAIAAAPVQKKIQGKPDSPMVEIAGDVDCPVSGDKDQLFDVNDNSVELLETAFVIDDDEENENEERRAYVDRTVQFLDSSECVVKSEESLIDSNIIKLPEGTTIHEVKDEGFVSTPVSPGQPPPMTPICTFGELTITPEPQQKEPLNLETSGKRSSLEPRLEGQPAKKERTVPPSVTPLPISEYNDFDSLTDLKSLFSYSGITMTDPIKIPSGRLNALMVNPINEIFSLLRVPPTSSKDGEMLEVPIASLEAMLKDYVFLKNDQKTEDNEQFINHMLKYSPKDVAESIAEQMMLPLSNYAPDQQAFSYNQQINSWRDPSYPVGPPKPVPPPYPTTDCNKPGECCKQPFPTISPSPMKRPTRQRQKSCCNKSSAPYGTFWPKPGYDSFAIPPIVHDTPKTPHNAYPINNNILNYKQYPANHALAYNASDTLASTYNPLLPPSHLSQQQAISYTPPPGEHILRETSLNYHQPSIDNSSTGNSSCDSSGDRQSPATSNTGSEHHQSSYNTPSRSSQGSCPSPQLPIIRVRTPYHSREIPPPTNLINVRVTSRVWNPFNSSPRPHNNEDSEPSNMSQWHNP
ncbi:uncharacterized protein LOC126838870 [Adelges cooleyi]|uniref:uncharacterized protein LOC126838870 n=1 Tax=Adelges cooleyi TaxID=133065 RepID=UPI0021801857|nr:uncharacterized protein LOC126838870 [Adelges cooleyi]